MGACRGPRYAAVWRNRVGQKTGMKSRNVVVGVNWTTLDQSAAQDRDSRRITDANTAADDNDRNQKHWHGEEIVVRKIPRTTSLDKLRRGTRFQLTILGLEGSSYGNGGNIAIGYASGIAWYESQLEVWIAEPLEALVPYDRI